MTTRRLLNLIRYLPRDSATACSVVGPEHPWQDSEYLLAAMADGINHLGWMFGRVNFKDVPKKPPKRIPRPGAPADDPDIEVTVNLTSRQVIKASSITIAEMDEIVARQTGQEVLDT